MRPFLFLLLLVTALLGRACADTVTYSTLIDTSPLGGQTGSLDFNFQSGPFGSRPATVRILRFGGNGTASGDPTRTGDVAGALPGDLVFDNAGDFNDYFQSFIFGSLLSFDIMLSGPAVGWASPGASGSTFAFSIFSDTDGTMPALTSNTSDGYAVTVDINTDGSTRLRNYTQTPTAVTPEPPTGLFVTTATLLVSIVRPMRKRLLTHKSRGSRNAEHSVEAAHGSPWRQIRVRSPLCLSLIPKTTRRFVTTLSLVDL